MGADVRSYLLDAHLHTPTDRACVCASDAGLLYGSSQQQHILHTYVTRIGVRAPFAHMRLTLK